MSRRGGVMCVTFYGECVCGARLGSRACQCMDAGGPAQWWFADSLCNAMQGWRLRSATAAVRWLRSLVLAQRSPRPPKKSDDVESDKLYQEACTALTEKWGILVRDSEAEVLPSVTPELFDAMLDFASKWGVPGALTCCGS